MSRCISPQRRAATHRSVFRRYSPQRPHEQEDVTVLPHSSDGARSVTSHLSAVAGAAPARNVAFEATVPPGRPLKPNRSSPLGSLETPGALGELGSLPGALLSWSMTHCHPATYSSSLRLPGDYHDGDLACVHGLPVEQRHGVPDRGCSRCGGLASGCSADLWLLFVRNQVSPRPVALGDPENLREV